MSKVIPKEQLSAYQRWELTAIGEQAAASVKLPTATEVEAVHQQAFREGFAAGYAEGQQRAASEIQQLSALGTGMADSFRQFNQALGQQVLGLALDMAKQMVRESLRMRPELINTLVDDILNSLPPGLSEPTFAVNPSDAAVLRKHLAAEWGELRWRVTEDATIAPGGCRVESPQSDVDATVEARWKRIATAFGLDHVVE